MDQIHIKQRILISPYPWLEIIMLVEDKEAERLNGWTIGFYHCKNCNQYQAYAYELPVIGEANPKAHNDRNAFWRKHAHGDGRIALLEKDMEI